MGASAWGAVLPTAGEAFAAVALPGILVAVVLGALFDAPGVRVAERGVAAAFPRGSLLLGCGLLALAASAVRDVARVGQEKFTVNVTVTLALATFVTVLLVGAPLVVLSAGWMNPRLERLEQHVRWVRGLRRGPTSLAVGGWVLVVGVHRLFPPTMLAPMIGAVTAFAAASRTPGRSIVAYALRGGRGRGLVAFLVAASVVAVLALPRVPAAGRAVLLYRSPLVGNAPRRGAHAGRSRRRRLLVDPPGRRLQRPRRPHQPGGARHPRERHRRELLRRRPRTSYVPYPQPAYVPPPALPVRPNMVVVMLDALRPDHLHFAGYPRATTPNLDAFRKDATWFRNAYTPGASTRFALASVMTGLDVEGIPARHGRTDLDLDAGTRVLGQRLAERGYDPVGYSISYVTQHIHGVGEGFRVWTTPWPEADWDQNFPVSATKTTDAGLAYLASFPDAPDDGAKPFFLFLHYQCTHVPYAKNPRWVYGADSIDDYDSGLSYCDDELGRLFAALRARPDADHTATFVFSDHGELFDEHGLSEHGSSIFQPDVRTVLLARVPFLNGSRSGGAPVSTIDTPVSLLDLEATWLALAGASHPESRGWNLMPLLEHGDDAGDRQRPIFLFTDLTRGTVRHQIRGVLQGRLKYVRDLSSGTSALYDVVSDPKELTDVSASAPRERARLAELLESWERGTQR